MKINPYVYVIVAISILIGLFFIFKPNTASENTAPDNSNRTQAENTNLITPTPNKEKVFELVIQGKRIISGPQTISVNQGDTVVLKITSDEDEELHVHAYDNSVELENSKMAELRFTADKSGRFPFELEKSKTEIGALEVQPK